MATRVHEVTFERAEDAAAFLASLSRQAHAPLTSALPAVHADVELLSPGARVYLSDDGLRVAELAFGPVPRVSFEPDSLRPATALVSIDLRQPTGMEDILRRLSAHYQRLPNHEVA